MKILGIGESVIDNVYRFDHNQSRFDGVQKGENGELPAHINLDGLPAAKHVGGPVLIALILMARLGASCTYMTSVGRDNDAEIIGQLLKHEKVKLIPKYQRRTKINTIFVDKTTGQRQKFRGPVKHASIKQLNRNFLHQFDLIIMDRHEQTAFYEVVQKKKTQTKLVIDPSTEVSKFTLDMIKYADYPIIPIEAVTPSHTNTLGNIQNVLTRLYEWSNKPLIITAGDEGSLIFDGKTAELIAPLQVNAVDTTGAGDIYRGGFGYGIMQGWELKKSARFANIVAALQCMKKGNAAAIPSGKEVLAYQEKLINGKETTTCLLNSNNLQYKNL